MKLLITGLNHRTAPVEIRERLAFDPASLPEVLRDLLDRHGVAEGMILSTCNRVEVTVAAEQADGLAESIGSFLGAARQVDPAWLSPHLYHFEDREAVRHLFRVAASLDSMVVGESQILGQMKSAYCAAKETGAIQGFLDTVLTRAFSVAKRVRSETEIGKSAVSVSYAAVELARDIFGSLNGRKVLLVGAGKMSELAARHLKRGGCSQIFVTNRTPSRAQDMAALFEGQIVDYTRFKERLPEMDIVLTSSGAPHYLLTRDDMRHMLEARRNRPVFVIDIAVPRNVDPAVNDLEHVFLYDIDDLQQVVQNNLLGRKREAEQAEEIIAEEVDRLMQRLESRQAVPAIVRLQEQLELVRQAELDRVRGRLGELTEQQEQAIDALTRGIINKIAHAPITELRRNAGRPDGEVVLDVIRRLFRLDEYKRERAGSK